MRPRLSDSMIGNPRFCHICGLRIPNRVVNGNHDLYGSVDHVLPLNRGGKNELGNRAPAHRKCNTTKGDDLYVSNERVLQLQVTIARLLNDIGIPTGPVQVREARRRVNAVPSGSNPLRGQARMLMYWEDDGGAVASF